MELLADLHPKLVHFPIAFLSGYVLFEFISIVVVSVLLVLKTIYWNS